MKYILLLTILFGREFCYSQTNPNLFQRSDIQCTDTVYRNIVIGTDTFVIKYEYNYLFYMEPAIGIVVLDSLGNENINAEEEAYRNNRHYFANILVYKNGKQIGKAMSGYFVKNGCFDADPKAHVYEAIRTNKVNKSLIGKSVNPLFNNPPINKQ